ncbi:MAG: 4-(cytidine 5'-diphospho)-2-C-methyl-D-erythritol kinase [Gammaproteobacteria bacterium]|nr:4-(cytidine 5'-diphospho)-2-C-methyl-D-erythritol kinase [Gammaproteobacteria bacterium]
MLSQDWPAPAKLNLFLHITGQRKDGYHLLQSVFQFLDYSDTLDFNIRDDGEIHRLNTVAGVAEADDLTLRAAKVLQQSAQISQGVDITLNKRLPIGGGVGGGSSDAATTLVALNHLWQAHLTIDQLAELGLLLGADVPVFVRGHAAFAEGIGEKLQVIELPEPWFLVVKPRVHVSTAEIFTDPQLTRNSPAIKICDLQTGAVHFEALENVCEPIATKHYPEIAQALERLKRYGHARMTGTGACVFVAFDHEADAQQALNDLPENLPGFVARGMNISPLHLKLAELIVRS